MKTWADYTSDDRVKREPVEQVEDLSVQEMARDISRACASLGKGIDHLIRRVERLAKAG